MYSKSIYYIFIYISISSCTSYRIMYQTVDQNDYNMRIEIKDPQYNKKLNYLGTGLSLGSTTAGGYLGYRNEIVKYNNKENEQVTSVYANAAIGSVIGYGVSSLINYIIWKQGKRISPDLGKGGLNEWITKYNPDYTLIEHRYNSLRLIKKIANNHNLFHARNYEDLTDFKKAFPKSEELNIIIIRDFPKFEKFEDILISFEKIYPESPSIVKAAIKNHILNFRWTLTESFEIFQLAQKIEDEEVKNDIKTHTLRKLGEMSFSSLYEEFEMLLKHYQESEWIPDIVAIFKEKHFNGLSSLSKLFQKNYVIRSNIPREIYIYLPPEEYGILTLNAVKANNIQTHYQYGNLLDKEINMIQVIPDNILSFDVNPVAIYVETNYENQLIKLSVINNASNPALLSFHTVDPDLINRVLNVGIEEVKEMIKSSLWRQLDISESNETKLKRFMDIIDLLSGTDDARRQAFVNIICISCNGLEKSLLLDGFKNFHFGRIRFYEER